MRTSGWRRRDTRIGSSPGILRLVPRRSDGRHEVHRGRGARRRRLAGHDRRRLSRRRSASGPTRATSPSRCRRIRCRCRGALSRPSRRRVNASTSSRTCMGARGGPGAGSRRRRARAVRRLLADLTLPAVVDADALFELEPADWPAPRVLTPHAGELGAPARRGIGLGGRAPSRSGAARRRPLPFVVLLKGPGTLVGAPGEGVLVCDAGTPHWRRPEPATSSPA